MNKNKILHIVVASTILLGGLAASTPYASAAVAEVERTVTLRERPSVNGDKIRYVRPGEQLSVLEKVNNYWLKVKDSNGRIGYVSSSSKYIDISSNIGTSGTKTNRTSYETDVLYGVNFRDQPSTDSYVYRLIPKGENIRVIEKINNSWLKIEVQDGTIGYISADDKYTNYKSDISSKDLPIPTTTSVQAVIDAGMKYLGTPYEFGSSRSNTSTFDCSDFVRQAYKDGAGITLPSNSRTQADYVRSIGKTTTDWRKLKPGDIMFFMSYKGSKASNYDGINKNSQRITHNGIYLGNGKILHTYSSTSGGVRIDTIEDKHWEYRFIFGGSAIK